MDKEVVYLYNGMLFRLQKEWQFSYTWVWTNLEDIMLSEINQSQNNKYYMIPLLPGL